MGETGGGGDLAKEQANTAIHWTMTQYSFQIGGTIPFIQKFQLAGENAGKQGIQMPCACCVPANPCCSGALWR